MNLKLHTKFALGYFLIITIIGMLLRLFPIVDFSFDYKHLLHAHSHIALLGWIYTALTTLIYKLFLANKKIKKSYRNLFWFTQFTLIGMLISFPITGYALFSIVFSTLFLFASYGFVRLFLKYTSTEEKKTNSYKLIRAALWFMVLSSIGPWVLGVIMNTLGNSSSWYRNAIYFYLHFQYNGWFIVTLVGMLFFVLEKHQIRFTKKEFSKFFWLLNIGVILTFFLSVLWIKPSMIFYIIAGIGGLLQIIAFSILTKKILQNKKPLQLSLSKIVQSILIFVSILFFLKLIVQFIGAFPSIANAVSSNIDFVIGYIHWIFLGIISCSLFAFLNYFKLLQLSKKLILLYCFAFLFTEILLFYKGTIIWLNFVLIESYYEMLAIASGFLLIAILLIFIFQFKEIKNQSQLLK